MFREQVDDIQRHLDRRFSFSDGLADLREAGLGATWDGPFGNVIYKDADKSIDVGEGGGSFTADWFHGEVRRKLRGSFF